MVWGERRLGGEEVPASHGTRTSHWWTTFKDIPVHGDPLAGKAEGNIRLWYENIDGFGIGDCEPLSENKNIKYYNNMISRVDIDIHAGVESRLQWDLVPRSHCLWKILDLREGSRCCHGHNVHEAFSIHQQGGTFMATNPVLGESVTE